MDLIQLPKSINFNGDVNFDVVEEALQHLASIDLIELINEAKVQRCQAIRDGNSCGRYVPYYLNSCGHASLCMECGGWCDICPICKTRVQNINYAPRLRLYDECIEANLISKISGERCGEDDWLDPIVDDVQRLYSLFDVALENNLASLICHYVTDVCMDESAVSSDPIIAILLDEVVVKDWCKQKFKIIVSELQGIYKSSIEEMKKKLDLLVKFSILLSGITKVLDLLELSFQTSRSIRTNDLHILRESVLKTKQHLEICTWCVKHEFPENSHHINLSSWRSAVRDRKTDAIKRSWPNSVNPLADSTRQKGTLFIEDALSYLDIEKSYAEGLGGEFEAVSLQKDNNFSVFRSMIDLEDMAVCYPFENLQAATDILFLHGSSDLVMAKQAIFIYYLFDRHWTMLNENWWYIFDDFAATFDIDRHSVLESFTFFLLDNHTNDALQKACHILPEISGLATHPKIAEVLLERKNSEAALMVLQLSGNDGTQIVPLAEAVTAVRVRVECALLNEAFMYQRTLCMKIMEINLKHPPSNDMTYNVWVEALVTEICCLCIRRNLLHQMIELPWNNVEEMYLYTSLFEDAIRDPTGIAGSLLVAFYIQRYRYPEAYQVDKKLQNIENDYISKMSAGDEVLLRIQSTSQWRTTLVKKGLDLLPEVEQQQVRNGKVWENNNNNNNGRVEAHILPNSSLLIPSSADSDLGGGPFLKPSDSIHVPTSPQSRSPPNLFNRGRCSMAVLGDEQQQIDSRSPNGSNDTPIVKGSSGGLMTNFSEQSQIVASNKRRASDWSEKSCDVVSIDDSMDFTRRYEEDVEMKISAPRWRCDDEDNEGGFAERSPIFMGKSIKTRFSRRHL